MKLNAKELRDVKEVDIVEKLKTIKRRPIYFILENIYDTYNIGGLFRLADGLAIEKMYICGESEIPPNSRIKKASIGTYKVVPWVYKITITLVMVFCPSGPIFFLPALPPAAKDKVYLLICANSAIFLLLTPGCFFLYATISVLTILASTVFE